MENLKRMIKKVMIFLLVFTLCVPLMELNNAQAAKLSSRKVDKLYLNFLSVPCQMPFLFAFPRFIFKVVD